MKLSVEYIVVLEPGVYIAPWDGDPGRTAVRKNAERFQTEDDASKALAAARTFRPFARGSVEKVEEEMIYCTVKPGQYAEDLDRIEIRGTLSATIIEQPKSSIERITKVIDTNLRIHKERDPSSRVVVLIDGGGAQGMAISDMLLVCGYDVYQRERPGSRPMPAHGVATITEVRAMAAEPQGATADGLARRVWWAENSEKFLRGTGRTTRMLLDAAKAISDGYQVVLVAATGPHLGALIREPFEALLKLFNLPVLLDEQTPLTERSVFYYPATTDPHLYRLFSTYGNSPGMPLSFQQPMPLIFVDHAVGLPPHVTRWVERSNAEVRARMILWKSRAAARPTNEPAPMFDSPCGHGRPSGDA